jgi:putative chitinase
MDVRAIQAALTAAGYPCAVDGQIGARTYAALFAFVGRQQVTPLITELGKAADQYFVPAGLTSSLRLAHALAQWAVETGGFKRMEEDLDYSAERLTVVWPKRFPTIAWAAPYAHNPVALANKSYGGRLGNSTVGDGWLYRGRGLTQLTGRANYIEAARITGLDLVGNPNSVAEPATGLRVACAYWSTRGINAAADADDVAHVRQLVNGGQNGIDEAKRYLARAKAVLR